jgi:hypothetical protein
MTAQEATVAIMARNVSAGGARKALEQARRDGAATFYLPWLWRQPAPWIQVSYAGHNAYRVSMVSRQR